MPTKHSHWLLLAISLFAATLCSAQIYKTVDKNGNVSFSDSPPAENTSNTEKLELEHTNSSAEVKTVEKQSKQPQQEENTQAYRISLSQPANQANITAEQRDLTIQAKVSPEPSKAHQIVINLDGESIPAGKTGSVTIHNIGRGEHKIYARLLKNGKFVSSSKTITVYVFRPSVGG